MQISVVVSGLDEEIQRLSNLKNQLSDFGSAMKTIGDLMVKYLSSEPFASQGGVFGTPWQALNPVYASRKAIGNTKKAPIGAGAYPGRGILQKTGELQDSFVSDSGTDYATITNTDPIGIYHNSTDPRTKMPYRPFMLVNDDVEEIIQDAINADVQTKLSSL